ncbi:MAG: hypothetical protein NC203_11810 [Firmicutes bacterium]|nr:hypothetical protein [[Eubacterium] siraeum]MCM1489038.1 hypothetical protein [Bacillota bacterium]
MSFKEEYGRYQRQIAPDKDFLNGLSEKMNRQNKSRQRKKAKARTLILSAGAVCCGAAAAVILVINTGESAAKPPDIIEVGAVSAGKIDYATGIFSEFSQNGLPADANDIPKRLAELLLRENAVLYKSDKSTFDYSGKQEREFAEALALRIEAAEETEEEIGSDIQYYMASDGEGNVVKFTISGDILEVSEKKFKLSP